ncbi:MAG: M1 family metallopeptidase [Luteibaculaceae bacterium]
MQFTGKKILSALLIALPVLGISQKTEDKFKQLETELPTPNNYRTASGAPGHEYWQQRADYVMNIELDDENQRIYGEQTVTYFNQSPDGLNYLWLQLDQNMRAKDSDRRKIATGTMSDSLSFNYLVNTLLYDFDGGFKIDYVKDGSNKDLPYTVNKTMMRIDLPNTLKPGARYTFKIKWWFNINDRMKIGGRSGLEYFEEEDNYLYTIAQFFPRMAPYMDNTGWQHKQFLGSGEFALNFGNYTVNITAPADHIVASTGTLQNPNAVLNAQQRERYARAQKSTDKPVLIVTQAEAEENEKTKATGKKTWTFKADNVRDFAFASSRKFMWDAMAVVQNGKTIMAMSYYPKEANPLWEQYSTRSVAHTLNVYSKFTFDYPYPVAISVNAANIGMEYPMICFNYGRTEKDGTYTERMKYGVISVIIHEVGHNYFPMIVNSDERQWTWMDEGLNTFLQYLAEQEWEENYPSRRGEPRYIVPYMSGDKDNIAPIMTNSESIYQLGNNAYGKPATALNILRETIMGRELFDFAFKEYSNRWKFKHPSPADFFRTMEDASGVDLDWFWRGWFFSTDHVDISLDQVKWFQVDTRNPEIEKAIQRERENAKPSVSKERNKTLEKWVENDPDALDFYNTYDRFKVDIFDVKRYERYLKRLTDEEKELLNRPFNFYELHFSNLGGLVMPVILKFEFTDGSSEVQYIPAEIWKMNKTKISKVFVFEKELSSVTLDPFEETADIDTYNNHWPRKAEPSRVKLYKQRNWNSTNPMQRAERARALQVIEAQEQIQND